MNDWLKSQGLNVDDALLFVRLWEVSWKESDDDDEVTCSWSVFLLKWIPIEVNSCWSESLLKWIPIEVYWTWWLSSLVINSVTSSFPFDLLPLAFVFFSWQRWCQHKYIYRCFLWENDMETERGYQVKWETGQQKQGKQHLDVTTRFKCRDKLVSLCSQGSLLASGVKHV